MEPTADAEHTDGYTSFQFSQKPTQIFERCSSRRPQENVHMKKLYSPITHQRITVASWLWQKDVGSASSFVARRPSLRLKPETQEARPTTAPQSDDATKIVPMPLPTPPSGVAPARPSWRAGKVQVRPATAAPQRGQWEVPLTPRAALASARAAAAAAAATHVEQVQRKPTHVQREPTHFASFVDEAEASGAQMRLRWREPLLVTLITDVDDMEMLLLHEGRMLQARERRDAALAAVRTHLHTQQKSRDRIRILTAGFNPGLDFDRPAHS